MNFQGEALPFTFDSGTGTSLLTEVFYETYKDWVDRNGQAKDEQSGGAGDIKTMRVVLLPTINFQSNGRIASAGRQADAYGLSKHFDRHRYVRF